MADAKISALTSATTPLAGTEVFPLVQTGTTKKTPITAVLQSGIDAAFGSLYSNTTPRATAAFSCITGNLNSYVINGTYMGYSTTNAPEGTSAWVFLIVISNATDQVQQICSLPGYANGKTYKRYSADLGTNWTSWVQIGMDINDNLVPAAAKGVNFTANTPAAGMTSQLLNWYEEGTWTPVIAGATTAGTQTYSVQVGRYTRMGNRVFYNCRVVMTAKDAATSGSIYVGGLPFTSNSTSSNFAPGAVSNAGNIDLSAGYTQISAEVQPNGTVVYLGQIGDNVAFSLLTDTALTNTTRIALSGHYEV